MNSICKQSIGFLTNNINQFGGIERVISILSHFFAVEEGWNVSIISLYTSETSPAFEIANNIAIIHANLHLGDDIKPYLCDHLKKHQYSTILTFHPTIGLEYMRIKRKFPSVQWIATEHSSPFDYTWKRKILNLVTYASADKLVVLTNFSSHYYKSHLISHTFVIPNASPFEVEETSSVLSKRIVAVGRLETVKRFDLLISAFSLIAHDYPEWILEIVGDGSQKQNLMDLVHANDMDDQVIFDGYRSDIKDIMLDASLAAVSSNYEGFSLVALEALECGLPIVSVDLPSIREIVSGYDAAIFSPVGNAPLLAQNIRNLIDDPQRLKHMSSEAKQCAKKYHISQIGKKWVELLTK